MSQFLSWSWNCFRFCCNHSDVFFGCFVAWSFIRLLSIFTWGFTKSFGFLVPCSLFSSLSVATGVCYLFHWVSNLWPLNVIVYYAWPWAFCFDWTDFVFIFYTKLGNVFWRIMQTCIACGWLLFAVSCVFISSYYMVCVLSLNIFVLLYMYDLDVLSFHYLSMHT